MPTPSFAETLDEALCRMAREPVSPPRAWPRGPVPPVCPAFLFARPLTAAAPRWAAPGDTPSLRAAHRLSDEQRQALARLAVLGAELPGGFTGDELLREYRRLALRYHPDRHAGCSAIEREQWSSNFTDLTHSYRCLQAVVDARH